MSRYDTIRGISLHQPYATWVADGTKTIETRMWATHYRGLLLVCSTKKDTAPGPKGFALAVVHLVGCRRMTTADESDARVDCVDGRWSWVLDDLRPLDRPVPIKGAQRLWILPNDHRLIVALAGVGVRL